MFMALTIASAILWHPADPAGVQGVRSGEPPNKEHSSAVPRHCQNTAFPLAQLAQ